VPITEVFLNLIFDLGGVVVTWEPEQIIAKRYADPAVRATVRDGIMGHDDWLELDRGTLSHKEAIVRAAHRTHLPEAEVEQFLRHVAGELVPVPETVDLLYRLKAKGHALYCLSNMHISFVEHLEQTYRFWEVFSGTVISCRLNLCKPEAAIYEHLLKTYGLDKKRTIFIDDLEANVTAAGKLGIQTIRFETAAQCERELTRLGCL
jgi:putative hydrolase of the HAD superfamily